MIINEIYCKLDKIKLESLIKMNLNFYFIVNELIDTK